MLSLGGGLPFPLWRLPAAPFAVVVLHNARTDMKCNTCLRLYVNLYEGAWHWCFYRCCYVRLQSFYVSPENNSVYYVGMHEQHWDVPCCRTEGTYQSASLKPDEGNEVHVYAALV